MSMPAARRAFSRDPALQATGRLRESGSAANLLCTASLRSTTRMTTTALTLRCQERSDDGHNVLSWNQSGGLNSNDGSLAEHTHTLLSAIYHDSRNGSSSHLPRIVHVTQNGRSECNADRRCKGTQLHVWGGRTLRSDVQANVLDSEGEDNCFWKRKHFHFDQGVIFLIFCWSGTCRFSLSRSYGGKYLSSGISLHSWYTEHICRLFTRDWAIVRYGMREDPDRRNQGCCTQ